MCFLDLVPLGSGDSRAPALRGVGTFWLVRNWVREVVNHGVP